MDDLQREGGGLPVHAISAKWSWLPFAFGIGVLILSAFVALAVGENLDENNRANLLTRVQTIGYLTDTDAVAGLSGTDADLVSDGYQNVKVSLFDLRNINADARFLYFMRSNGTKLFFLADSEYPESADYSPPGQIYEDTSDLQLSNYDDEVSFTEGPYKDEWGTWVSAYAPLYTTDGAYAGIVGMDVDAQSWREEILSVMITIVIAGLVLCILFFILGLHLRRSLGAIHNSERMNNKLLHEKAHADALVAQARIGEWAFTPASGAVSFNEEMYRLLGVEKGKTVTFETFMSSFTFESRREFEGMIEVATHKTEEGFSVVMSLTSGPRLRFSAKLSYGSGISPVRISGIAQEIA